MIICVCMIVLWIVLNLGKYTAPKYYKTNECLIMTMTKNIFNLSQGDMQVLMIMAILPSSSPSNPKDFYREYILHMGCWEIIVLTLLYLDKKRQYLWHTPRIYTIVTLANWYMIKCIEQIQTFEYSIVPFPPMPDKK